MALIPAAELFPVLTWLAVVTAMLATGALVASIAMAVRSKDRATRTTRIKRAGIALACVVISAVAASFFRVRARRSSMSLDDFFDETFPDVAPQSMNIALL